MQSEGRAPGGRGCRRRAGQRSRRARWPPALGSAPARAHAGNQQLYSDYMRAAGWGLRYAREKGHVRKGLPGASRHVTSTMLIYRTPGPPGACKAAIACKNHGGKGDQRLARRTWPRRSRGTSSSERIFMNRQRSFSTTPGSARTCGGVTCCSLSASTHIGEHGTVDRLRCLGPDPVPQELDHWIPWWSTVHTSACCTGTDIHLK